MLENIGKCAIDMIMSLVGPLPDKIEEHIKLDWSIDIRESADVVINSVSTKSL